MAQSTLAPIERSQFDDFLCASIGYERNGMSLSVLSALARRDIDPWREAACLAQMPTEAAIRKMQALIAALPEESIAPSNPEAIAARLIPLLPPRGISRVASRKASPRGNSGRATNYRILLFLILMSFLLTSQFLLWGAQRASQSYNVNEQAHNATSSPASR
jgi:hypothetical protein